MLFIETLYNIGIILPPGTADCGSCHVSYSCLLLYRTTFHKYRQTVTNYFFCGHGCAAHVRPADIHPYDNMGCYIY